MKQEINKIIKFLQEEYISDEHRHAEINLDCPECRARLLEGMLYWLKDAFEDDDDEEEYDSEDDKNHL